MCSSIQSRLTFYYSPTAGKNSNRCEQIHTGAWHWRNVRGRNLPKFYFSAPKSVFCYKRQQQPKIQVHHTNRHPEKKVLWSGRSGDVTRILQAAIEITCHDHSTTACVGLCYILLRYLVFVFVVCFLFVRWFPCIRHSIIFWGFPHVMVHVP